MIKILVVCDMGMTSSLIKQKMNKAASDKNIEVEVEACPIEELENYLDGTQAILVSPQIRFRIDEIKNEVGDNIVVQLIDTRDYGLGRGNKILEKTLQAINQ